MFWKIYTGTLQALRAEGRGYEVQPLADLASYIDFLRIITSSRNISLSIYIRGERNIA